MEYNVILCAIISIAVTSLILSFFLIIKFRLFFKKEIELMNKKISHLEEVMDNADNIINEIINLSGYVTDHIEDTNERLLSNIKKLEEKNIESKSLIEKLDLLISNYDEELLNNKSKNTVPDIPKKEPNKIKHITNTQHRSFSKEEIILKLSKEGKDIREIAQELHIGQREVQLVIEMLKNKMKA
jgi:DNA-binding NarL/FixJ family response regulator